MRAVCVSDKYINADALLHELCTSSYPQDVDIGKAYYIFKKELRNAPVADVVPVVHGHWIDTGSGQECSICGEIQYGYDSGRFYCQNCGTKMDEVTE